MSLLVPIGFAMGGAGLITFAVAGGIAAGRASDLKDVCGADNIYPTTSEADLDDALLASHVSTAGAVIDGLGVAAGVVGLILSSTGGDTERSSLVPLIGPGFVGLTGRF